MERRQFLRRGAVAGAVGVTGIAAYSVVADRPGSAGDGDAPDDDGYPGTSDGVVPPRSTHRHGDEFGTVVNALWAGADPEGEEPIDGLLERYADDDTLLSFPPGTYRLPRVELVDFDHLGIAAAHDERPTFVAPADSCRSTDPHVQFGRVTDFLLEGIDFDFRNRGAGGAINVIAAGDATVRGITARGSCRRQIAKFRIDVRNPEGVGLVEDLRLRQEQDTGWLTAAYVGQHHSGEVTFRNCEFVGFTDNGLYGSSPGIPDGADGVVHSVDCRLENNNVSNLRLGPAGSSARGDSIVVEAAPDAESLNLRGIRFRRSDDQVVEDCDIRFGPDVTESFGAIVFHADGGPAHVENTRITMDSEVVPAVRAFAYSGDGPGGPTFKNVTVDGEASSGYAVRVNGRDETAIRKCTIEQSGDERGGIHVTDSQDCELVDCRVDVTGHPLVLEGTTMRIRNTTFVTPHGERHVDDVEAGPGDFRPDEWETTAPEG